jgi:hypothetical protein
VRALRRVLVVAATIAFLGIGLTTTAGADTTPADCTTTGIGRTTAKMTCTDRPADQHWHTYASCASVGSGGHLAFGSSVVGNGSSTVNCFVDYAIFLVFVPE